MSYNTKQNAPSQQLGITLMELMVALVVVAILSAVAYPSYQQFVVRSKLSEATNQLANVRLQMEHYYQDNRSYLNAQNTCGVMPNSTENFKFTCKASGSTFTLRAGNVNNKGLGKKNQYVYTIDHNGSLGTLKFKGSKVAKNCWVLKGDEC